MSFYIEKLIITGKGKEDSMIEFSDGVNIIYGPSNTGKTYIVKCIDYLFGSKNSPFDLSLGYELVKLIVKTTFGNITLTRKIGETKIEVSSSDNRIESGKYALTGKYEKTINSVWLSLIGINEKYSIIKNEDFKKQTLTWRTFQHMFMLTETKIISEQSALLPQNNPSSNTAAISSLIFLMTGNDYSETEAKDSKEMKEAKKNAVKTYINKELFRLSERKQEILEELNINSNIDLSEEISKILLDIECHEKNIEDAISRNQNLLKSLHEKNESLSECVVLLSRYHELKTQYESDLKRLSFIVDGEANLNNNSNSQCPFCDGAISIKKSATYIVAAKADYKKIKLQAKDLEKAETALTNEKIILEQNIELLLAEKQETEALIKNELQPRVAELKEKLGQYRTSVELQNEIVIIKRFADLKTSDIIDVETEDESNIKFKVKEHLDYSFTQTMGEEIKNLLDLCNYENLLSVRFDKSDMDIVINGKKKSSNGKGYNAFLNSTVSVVLMRYLREKAKHSPNLLILDSPILSLKEKGEKKPAESMKNALFENIIKYQEGIQTIIIENEIPKINYEKAHTIQFTKEKGNGRYGLLSGITD